MSSFINEYLSPEMLVKIFSHYIETEGPLKFLRNIPPVCKLWKDLSSNSTLWKEVNWESISRNFEHLLKLGERGLLAHTHTLDLSTCHYENYPKMSAENLLQVIQYCHNLKSLDVSHNDVITEEVFKSLAENFPRMEKLAMLWSCGDSYDEHIFDCPQRVTLNRIDPILKSFGQNLTYLKLACHLSHEERVVSKIADSCPALEEFHLSNIHCHKISMDMLVPFPIYELQAGCPKLRTLNIYGCRMVFIEELKAGFREMKSFQALGCDFNGFAVSTILHNSTGLKSLTLVGRGNRKLSDIFTIPSNEVEVFTINMIGGDIEPLEKAVSKWRRTLKTLCLDTHGRNTSGVVKVFLEDNRSPVLEKLVIDRVDTQYLESLIRVCEKLRFLDFTSNASNKHLKILKNNREEVLKLLNPS